MNDKKIFVTICILISFTITKAQNFELLNKAIEKSKVIKSGSYKVIKKHKFFDYDLPNESMYDIQFCEINGTTNCIIKDFKNNNILFFDSSVWVKIFYYKDSVLDRRVKFNPNKNLLYIGMQPYGLLRLLPDEVTLKKRIAKNSDSNSFKIYDSFKNGTISESDYIKLVIDSNSLIATTFINYGKEILDSVNYNIQNMEETIYDVKINNFTEKQFLALMAKAIDTLPIRKKTISEYDKKTVINDSLIDLNVFSDFKEISTGKKLALHQEKNLLFFTYLGCIPCKEMLPQLDAVYSKYKNKMDIIGINAFDSSSRRILIYKNANKIKFDYYFNENISLKNYPLKKLQLKSFPTLFITDKKGNIELIIKGYTNNLNEIVEEHLSN
jgi:thiol-disulfide isomerase/thioredoxin